MAFNSVDNYQRFMGRWSEPLAGRFLEAVGIRQGQRVLDVGCGPGALTSRLVAALGPDAVAAVDPSAPFVAATRDRLPGVEVRQASAESLPHPDGAFDVTLAQLVVHFMADPVAGLVEMGRVTRPGGIVAACVWDYEDGGPIAPLWAAARDLDPLAPQESGRPGTRAGELESIAARARLDDIVPAVLEVELGFSSFEDWWQPFLLGIGPAGEYVAGMEPAARASLANRCRELLPSEPFRRQARAWCVTARTREA